MIAAVRCRLLYPAKARLSCAECQRNWYDPAGDPVERPKGHTLKRPLTVLPPCNIAPPGSPGDRCPKIPDDAPQVGFEYAVEMSDRHRQALEHWEECEAVHDFPDDWIVRRHARIFTALRREAEQVQSVDVMTMLLSTMKAKR